MSVHHAKICRCSCMGPVSGPWLGSLRGRHSRLQSAPAIELALLAQGATRVLGSILEIRLSLVVSWNRTQWTIIIARHFIANEAARPSL